MGALWQDIRFALRSIRKNPGFTAVAVLSLALGVGANTTIFTLLNAAFLAPLPVERPSDLVAVYTTDQANIGGLGNLQPMSYPNLKDMRQRNEYLPDMAGYSFPTPVSVITASSPQQAFVELVTGNYFSVLGVKAAKGRVFGADEDTKPGDAPVAVLSQGFWQRRLGGDPAAVGKVMPLNGVGFTVIGIAPEGFKGINSLISPDMWVPSMMYAEVLPSQERSWIDERRALLFFVAARLKPGATMQQAEANLKSIATTLEREYPAPNKGRSVALRPLVQATIFPGIREIFLLGGAELFVIDLQNAPELKVLQELFEFFSHGGLYRPPGESIPAPRGAGSSVPAGPDHRDHNGRLRAPLPGAARGDTRAPGGAVGARQA